MARTFKTILVLILSLTFLSSCSNKIEENDVVAVINDSVEITFKELSRLHSGEFFERRYPNSELNGFEEALEDLLTRRLKQIDFLENENIPKERLLESVQRTINDEIINEYYLQVILDSYYGEEEIEAEFKRLKSNNPAISFEGSKNRIINNLRDKYTDEALEEYEVIKDEQILDEQIEWNEEGLDRLVEWSRINNFFQSEYQSVIDEELNNNNNFVLLTYNNTTVDIAMLKYLISDILQLEDNSSPSKNILKAYLVEAMQLNELLKKAKELEIDEDILSMESSTEALKVSFLRLYNGEMIYDKIPSPTEENLLQFYEDEKEGYLYQVPKRIIYIAEFDSEAEANNAYKEITESSKTFEEVSNRSWKVKSYVKNEEGQIESYLSSEKPIYGDIAFSLGEGEISNPIPLDLNEESAEYGIVYCSKAYSEGIVPFDEVENLERSMRIFYTNMLTQQVEEELFSKYEVEIFRDVLIRKINERK